MILKTFFKNKSHTQTQKLIRARGFTIIEIILAMTVLFVGILGVFAIFPMTYKMAELSKAATQMTLVGQSKVDEVLALGFNNITPQAPATFDLTEIVPDVSTRSRLTTSTLEVAIAPTSTGGTAINPLNSNAILYEITVTIRYQMKAGKPPKEELFVTYLSNLTH